MKNPYEKGTFVWQQWNAYHDWHEHRSLTDLVAYWRNVQMRANDFLNNGLKSASDFQFQADCLAEIIRYKMALV